MPQLILEFSSNVIEKNKLPDLFSACHSILVNILPTKIETCKSRAIERDIYCVGNGDFKNAFVHINLKVLPGRDLETLNKLGDALLNTLKNYFSESLKKLNLQISLEIDELQKTYFKITS